MDKGVSLEVVASAIIAPDEFKAGFSKSAEFIAKLSGVIKNGIEFLPYGG